MSLAGPRVKGHNALAVMRALASLETASRTQLAQHVGIDRSTMTHIASALLDAGLIVAVAQVPAGRRGGRRAELLAIERTRYAAAGADVRSGGARWTLVDLHGRPLGHGSLGPSLPSGTGAVRRAWLGGILEDLRLAVREQAGDRHVLGVGLALPGLLDRDRRRLVASHELEIRAIDLPDLWSPDDPPLIVDGDAACYAWHEIAEHGAHDADGVYVYTKLHRDGERFRRTGAGIGVVIVEGGRILRGHRGASGELRGYRWTPECADQLGVDLEQVRAERGEHGAIERLVTELVRNLVVIGSTLDPRRIVVSGDLAVHREQIGEIAAQYGTSGFAIDVRESPEFVLAAGAAQMVREGLFTDPALRLLSGGAVPYESPV